MNSLTFKSLLASVFIFVGAFLVMVGLILSLGEVSHYLFVISGYLFFMHFFLEYVSSSEEENNKLIEKHIRKGVKQAVLELEANRKKEITASIEQAAEEI